MAIPLNCDKCGNHVFNGVVRCNECLVSAFDSDDLKSMFVCPHCDEVLSAEFLLAIGDVFTKYNDLTQRLADTTTSDETGNEHPRMLRMSQNE